MPWPPPAVLGPEPQSCRRTGLLSDPALNRGRGDLRGPQARRSRFRSEEDGGLRNAGER